MKLSNARHLTGLWGLLFLLLIPNLQAQKPKPADFGIKSRKALNAYFEGEQYMQWRDREAAMAAFETAIEIEPDFAHAHYRLGQNAILLHEYEDALPHLEKAYAQMPDAFGSIGYYLGEAYFFTGQYENAIAPYQRFLDAGRGPRIELTRSAINLRKARFAARAIADSVEFRPENLGENINTERDEYLPWLTADASYLLFTARRPGSMGDFDPQTGDYPEDFFFSEYRDGAWQPAQNLGPPINTVRNEGAGSISQDGKTIFFTACNREDGLGSCDLYIAYREGDRWSEPQNLGPNVNSKSWDSQPCISHDGRILYFASARPGGEGGRDIWFSRQVDGEWMPAQNLGAPVNSPGNETSPFLHADGSSLYFASDFHPGFGAMDLFLSRREAAGAWGTPVNLGYPLNTAAEESNIFISTSGELGFINSDREGSLGKSDLWSFELDRRIRPQLATFLRGITRDSITHTPVPARIRLMDVEAGDTIRDLLSGRSDGKFLMSLPLERSYAAFVEAPGYLFASRSFYLKDLEAETYFDLVIDLVPIRKDAKVKLENIFFASGSYELMETSEPELKTLRSFLRQNPQLRIEIQGHTDDVGQEADNQLLSQRRAEAVQQYLIEAGIDPARIEATGYGESRPVASNETEEGRAANRRTEFRVLDF